MTAPTQDRTGFAWPSEPGTAPPLTGGTTDHLGWVPPTVGPPTPAPPSPFTPPTPPKRRGNGGRVVLAAVVATGLAGLGWTARDLVGEPSASAPVVTQTSAGQTPVVVTDDIEPVAAVATSLSPAVVQIEEQEGLGSGVVYDAGGLIVTNAHVVGDNSTVGVRFADGSRVEGQVLGADPEADIAVVQVDHPNLVAATLATTDAEVGQMAVALGSPFGLQQTVTAGIVSAVDRPVDGQSGVAVAMIQTDAPINPGNSGGALANRKGELIGINASIYSTSGDNSGIGFAIPIDTAMEVADRIVAGESLDKGYLGVRTTSTDDGSPGAMIDTIDRNTPAAEAGLDEGDVIVAVDGEAVRAPDDLAARIAGRSPGETIEVEIVRSGSSTTLTVTLGARP